MRRVILHWKHLGLMLAVFAIGMLIAHQARRPYEVRLGEPGDSPYLEGFYDAEANAYDAYRWSGNTAVVRFPGVGCSQVLGLTMRMSGARPQQTPLPQVALAVNGRTLSPITAEGQMKSYEFHIPTPMTRCSGDVEVEIDSEAFSPGGGDLRELGVMVDWVRIRPQGGGPVLPAPLPLASLALAATIAFLPLRGRQVPSAAVLAAAIGITLVAGLLFAFQRIWASQSSWRLLVLTATGYLAVIALDGIRALDSGRRRIDRHAIGIVLLALIVQLALLAPSLDESPNVWTYKNWIWHADIRGLQSLYVEQWALTQPVYPPLSLYMLKGLGWFYESTVGPVPPPAQEPTPSLSFLIRLPGVMCSTILALTAFLWLSPRHGHRRAYLGMAAFAFNPSVALITTRWGQMDSVHSLFVVLAVICAVSEKPALSWVFVSLGVFIKPQALLFVPVILILTWRESGCEGVLKGILGCLSTAAIVMSPFVSSGAWHKVIAYFAGLSGQASYWTGTIHDSHNLWWVLNLGRSVPKTIPAWKVSLPAIGSMTYEFIGLLLFAAGYLFALWRLASIHERGWMWVTVAYVPFAFFMLPASIHANYMYAVFPLLVMALSERSSVSVMYVVLSATWLLNLLLQYPGADWGASQEPGSVMMTLVSTVRMANALLNTLILGHWTILLLRKRGGLEREPAVVRQA